MLSLLLIDSRTFLGLTPEWAGVMVSLIALIFAALGYRKLIKDAKDVQSEISALNETAKNMASLATSSQHSQDASRKLSMPWLKHDSFSFHQETLQVIIKNVGLSSALLLRTESVNNTTDTPASFEKYEQDRLNPGETIALRWHGQPNNIAHGMVQICIWFSDHHGARYVQRYTWIRGEIDFDPPKRIEEGVLIPDYMKEMQPPTL